MRMTTPVACLVLAVLSMGISEDRPVAEQGLTVADLTGAWAGTLSHDGETTPFALQLDLGDDGKVAIRVGRDRDRWTPVSGDPRRPPTGPRFVAG